MTSTPPSCFPACSHFTTPALGSPAPGAEIRMSPRSASVLHNPMPPPLPAHGVHSRKSPPLHFPSRASRCFPHSEANQGPHLAVSGYSFKDKCPDTFFWSSVTLRVLTCPSQWSGRKPFQVDLSGGPQAWWAEPLGRDTESCVTSVRAQWQVT